MSLNSVKHYFATQAPNISLSGLIWKQVAGFAQRPKRGKAGFDVFVIVGRVSRRESRLTSPRGPAEKELRYDVEVMLYAEHSDAQVGGDHFDALIENTCQAYRALSIGNPTLTDSFGGPNSYLTNFGEEIAVDLLDPFFTDAEETRPAFQAVLTVSVSEILTG